MLLDGKVAIVTGGGHGIGKAYCQALSGEGASVVIADIDFNAASDTAKEIEAKGGKVLALKTDVSREDSTQEMAKSTSDRFGRIDILINNAAFYAELDPKPWDAITVEEWDKVMAVNIRGIFLCCRAVLPQMKAQGKGKIINIASGTVFRGVKGRLHYMTSKAGVVGFTRALAREVGDFGVRINTLSPGLVYTGRSKVPKEWFEKFSQDRCLKRIEYPEDLVGTIIFLSSDLSDFMTGQHLSVDGGDNMT